MSVKVWVKSLSPFIKMESHEEAEPQGIIGKYSLFWRKSRSGLETLFAGMQEREGRPLLFSGQKAELLIATKQMYCGNRDCGCGLIRNGSPVVVVSHPNQKNRHWYCSIECQKESYWRRKKAVKEPRR